MRSIFTLLPFRLLLVVLFFSSSLSELNAQTHTPKTVAINEACGGYWEYLPVNYSSTTGKYPLLIYISGGNGAFGNGTASSMAIILNQGVPRVINENLMPKTFTVNGETTSFIIISPQFRYKPSPTEVNSFIDYIVSAYSRIDQSRICLTGFSIGGDVAWKTPYDLTSAGRLAALVPVAGYNNPYSDDNAQYIAAGKLPVWAIHSNADAAPVGWTISMVNKINSYNPAVPPVLSRPDGLTHEQTHAVVYEPGYKPNGLNIYEWCLQFRRIAATNPPVANAGADKTITLPTSNVTLTGSGSDPDGGTLTYRWTKISGPAAYTIASPTAASTAINGLTAGDYQFQLEVTDPGGLTGRDTAKVTVLPAPNQLPAAKAGADVSITLPQNSVTLSAAGSTDPDGTIASYNWSKISGPASFTINNAAAASPVVSNLASGTYAIQLTVTDNSSAIARDTMVITVNAAANQLPVANAGADQTITLPANTASLSGASSSDADGSIAAYQWSQVAGPSAGTLSNAASVTATASNLVAGTYSFELTVRDNGGATAKDTVRVIVNPAPGSTRLLKVNIYSGSNPAGTGWNNWNVQSSLTLSNAKFADGSSSGITASLNVSNAVADNGSNYPVTMCPAEVGRSTSYSTVLRTVTLSGLDNTKKYELEVYSSRGGTGNTTKFTVGATVINVVSSNNYNNKAVFTSITPSSGQIKLTLERMNTYNYINGFTLTEIGTDPVTPANQNPVAAAGPDQQIQLPVNSVQLNGSGSADSDGTIVSYQWTKVSGPSQFNLSNATTVNPVLSNLVAGVYVFELRVTDDKGAMHTDSVTIAVNAAANQLPVANAGSNQTVNLPSNTASLNGTASSDPDGSIASYQWRQLSGPSTAVLNNATTSVASAGNLIEGTYSFELLVKDNNNAEAKDTANVTVNPPVLSEKIFKVNIYGGANPAGAEWNNWNVQSNLTLSNTKYADGTSAAITATLNLSNAIADNSNNYPVTMCPAEVGRTTSYSTVARYVTLSGLDNTKRYELEVYSSRSGAGNTTKFTVGSTVINILSSNNYNNKAVFTNIAPSSGQIRLTIERLNTYNYINGFTLKEIGSDGSSVTARSAGMQTATSPVSEVPSGKGALGTYPNPFRDNLDLQVDNDKTGTVKVTLINQDGKPVKFLQFVKEQGLFRKSISLQDLQPGVYFLQVQMAGWTRAEKVVKM